MTSGTSLCHFWPGEIKLAFVFSVPGTSEFEQGRPAAGITGQNLSSALDRLNRQSPRLFPKNCRYAYRITNAYAMPLSKALGSGRSEAKRSEILAPENIRRLTLELQDCHTVILCGQRAGWSSSKLRAQISRAHIVTVPHISNQALSTKFDTEDVQNLTSPAERRAMRVSLWAAHLLAELNRLAVHPAA